MIFNFIKNEKRKKKKEKRKKKKEKRKMRNINF